MVSWYYSFMIILRLIAVRSTYTHSPADRNPPDLSFLSVPRCVESSPTTTPGRTAQEDLELVNGKVMYLFVHNRTEADYCLFHSLLSAAGQCCFGSESVGSMLWCRHHDVVNPLLIWIGRIESDQI